jgi:hypothetical protein
VDAKGIEPIEQVGSKRLLHHIVLPWPIRRGNNPDIGMDALITSLLRTLDYQPIRFSMLA